MPAVYNATEGVWTLSGRVIATLDSVTVVLSVGGRHFTLHGVCARDAEPGDLVRVNTVPIVQSDCAPREVAAQSIERVFRPKSPPLARGGQAHRVEAEGLIGRLALRQRVIENLRAWFATKDFIEVSTPTIAPCPGLDLHLKAFSVATPESLEKSSSRATDTAPYGFLVTSPELHLKRLLVGGVERCFELARCFRASELGSRHQPEFTMLEWYRAWSGLDEVLADTEALVHVAATTAGTTDAITVRGQRIELLAHFERLTVRDAFARFAPEITDPIALAGRDEETYFTVLATKIEPALGWTKPVFLTEFPAVHASLARLHPRDPTVCLRAELYVAGVELCNAFDELTDPDEQRRRWNEQTRSRALSGAPTYPQDEGFLRALDEGMPPSGGNALGVDRLIALVGGFDDIAEIQCFPRRIEGD